MKNLYNKTIPVLILILYFFPKVGKEFHSFKHKDDFHCSGFNETHYHELRYNCLICNFLLPSNFVCNEKTGITADYNFKYLEFQYITPVLVLPTEQTMHLRAPPEWL